MLRPEEISNPRLEEYNKKQNREDWKNDVKDPAD